MPRRALLLLPLLLLVVAVVVVARECTVSVDVTSTPAGGSASPTTPAAGTRSTPPTDGHSRRRRVGNETTPTPGGGTDAGPDEDLSTLRGRVEFADGTPARGRSVRALLMAPISQAGSTAITDEDGAFELGANPFVDHSLEVSVPLDDLDQVTLYRGDVSAEDEVRFVIPPKRVITGTLVSEGRAPLPNVKITAWSHELRLDDDVRMLGTRLRNDTSRTTQAGTTVDGRFRFVVLEGMQLSLQLPEHPTLTIVDAEPLQAGAEDVVVVATEGAAIEGVCVDERGETLAGVGIFATADDHERIGGSGDDGRFRITGLTPGATYVVQGRRHGWMASPEIRVPAGTTGVRVELVQGYTISGQLLGPDGELTGTGLIVLSGTFRGAAITHEIPLNAGRFVQRGIVGRDFEVTFRAEGGRETALGRLPEPDADGVTRLDLSE